MHHQHIARLTGALIVAVICCMVQIARAADGDGRRWSLNVNYAYELGLKMHSKTMGTITRKDADIYGHYVDATILYHISPALSVGAVVGIDLYSNGHTIPLFATVRYRPIQACRDVFLFGSAGYAPFRTSEPSFERGSLMNGGIGYRLRWKRHFSPIFRLGYSYGRLHDAQIYVYELLPLGSGVYIPSFSDTYENVSHHSLLFSVGVAF